MSEPSAGWGEITAGTASNFSLSDTSTRLRGGGHRLDGGDTPGDNVGVCVFFVCSLSHMKFIACVTMPTVHVYARPLRALMKRPDEIGLVLSHKALFNE